MAIVYETSELEQEQFPLPGAHIRAGELWVTGLRNIEATSPGGLIGAEAYGSMALATDLSRLGIRNDMDGFGQWDDEHPMGYEVRMALIGLRKRIQAETRVRVDGYWTPASAIIAGSDETVRNPFLCAHLLKVYERNSADQRLLVGNPLTGVDPLPSDGSALPQLLQFAAQYAAHKRHQFETATSNTELDVKPIQRALELPWALGRMLVELAHYIEAGEMAPELITRKIVNARAIELDVDTSWRLPFLLLNSADVIYSDLVERTARRELRFAEHEQWLQDDGPHLLHQALALADATSLAINRWAREQERGGFYSAML